MTKKSRPGKSTSKGAAGPQSKQLEAIHKLSRSGRHREARTRVMELLARYPDFKPLLPLAWEVEDNAENFFTATLHAWDWSQASPNSTAALQALADSAMPAGLVALSASAAKKLAEVEGISFPEMPPVHGELGDLDFEQSVTVDLARLFLTNGRFDEVIALLKDIDHPSARNNRALARFEKGEIAAALADFEENWRHDTRNLFGLHHVVRLRLWTGGRASAAELADALSKGRPTRAEDVYGQMFGLLLLGMHATAIDAWRAVREAEFWNDFDPLHAYCAYLAGIAALREGDVALASDCASEALDIDPDNDDAAEMSEVLAMREFGEEADLKVGEFHDWFPSAWLDEVRAASRIDAKMAALDALCRHCDAHPDYLAVAAELGGPLVRLPALEMLKQRASSGDAAALDTLRGLLMRPCGPDEVRLELNQWLEENGYLPHGEPHPLLIRGTVHESRFLSIRLTDEPKEAGLPPKAQARLERMHHLLARNDLKGALHLAQQLVDEYPEHPILLGNLASIKEALHHSDDEVERLYRRAQEANPDYLFAQTGLARIAARKGDPERARELVKPLYGREEYHFSEWRAILAVEHAIAMQQGDMGAVWKLEEQLRDLQEQFR